MKNNRTLKLFVTAMLCLAFSAAGVLASPTQMDAVKKGTKTVVAKTKHGSQVTMSKTKTVYGKSKHGVGKAYGWTKRGAGKVYRQSKKTATAVKKSM